jgi:threonine aldolase
MGGEAVVYLDRGLAERAVYVRKQVNQLPSKMRFVAAQFNALLHDELWIRLAEHSNEMTQCLYRLTDDIPGVAHRGVPQVNSVFPSIPRDAIGPLQDWCFFWDWNMQQSQVRWMTAWDTTLADVERFAGGVRHLLA